MRALETRVPPPLLALAIAAAMGAVAWGEAPGPIPWPARAVSAAALFGAAALYGPRAIRAFGHAGTTIDPIRVERASTLVTTGVFARSRNPMYVAMALLLAAWAVWLGRLAPALGPIAFVAFINRFQIMPEEHALGARFGEQYGAYRRAVPRWLC